MIFIRSEVLEEQLSAQSWFLFLLAMLVSGMRFVKFVEVMGEGGIDRGSYYVLERLL